MKNDDSLIFGMLQGWQIRSFDESRAPGKRIYSVIVLPDGDTCYESGPGFSSRKSSLEPALGWMAALAVRSDAVTGGNAVQGFGRCLKAVLRAHLTQSFCLLMYDESDGTMSCASMATLKRALEFSVSVHRENG
jgi:hypothetical protein